MKLMCISNKWESDENRQYDITIGKVYEDLFDIIDDSNNRVKKGTFGKYIVTNDKGRTSTYGDKSFMPLDKWREEKLKEIGI